MKTVIVSTAPATDGSASGILIGNLIDALRESDVEVVCLTVKRSLTDPDISTYRGAAVHHVNYIDGLSLKRMPVRDLIHTAWRVMRRHHVKKSVYDSMLVRRLARKLSTLAANADAIIAVCACFDAAASMLKVTNTKAVKILYEFDPLSGNVSLRSKPESALLRYERRLVSECDLVFAPEYIRTCMPKDIASFVRTAELPAIVKGNSGAATDEKTVSCIFAGEFFRGIREPEFMLELFARFTDPRIHLYLLSDREREVFRKYEDSVLAGRMSVIGHVSETECDRMISEADVLVNVGNLTENQLPSKLLSYMCRGKLILNIHPLKNCPSLKYTQKYPLAIDVFEGDGLADGRVRSIEQKMLGMYKERVPFEDVETAFPECTPKYIAEELLRGIAEVSK